MKKSTILGIVGALVLLGAGWFVLGKGSGEKTVSALPEGTPEVATTLNNPPQFIPIALQTSISTDDWKTYQDDEFGFKIKYPPQYSVQINPGLGDNRWRSATFFSIFDPKDTSKSEFHVIPVHVVLDKQPSIHGGEVYHTIDEYVQSGVQEYGAQKTDYLIVNGVKTARYQFEQGDAEDAPMEEYIFIKNDLLYRIFLNANNQYRDAIVQSIEWQ